MQFKVCQAINMLNFHTIILHDNKDNIVKLNSLEWKGEFNDKKYDKNSVNKETDRGECQVSEM